MYFPMGVFIVCTVENLENYHMDLESSREIHKDTYESLDK